MVSAKKGGKSNGRKPLMAAFLSFLVVGMGQTYNREDKKAILLFVLFLAAGSLTGLQFINTVFIFFYLMVFLVWGYAIYDAYSVAAKTREQKPYHNAIVEAIAVLIFWGVEILFLSGIFHL